MKHISLINHELSFAAKQTSPAFVWPRQKNIKVFKPLQPNRHQTIQLNNLQRYKNNSINGSIVDCEQNNEQQPSGGSKIKLELAEQAS